MDLERGNVLIVNQSFAHLVFGDRNPVGQRIRIERGENGAAADDGWYEVVGMVRDVGWQMPEPIGTGGHVSSGAAPAGHGVSAWRCGSTSRRGFAPRLRVLANAVDPEMQVTDVRLLSDVGGRGATLTWTVTYVVGVVSCWCCCCRPAAFTR